MTDFAKTRKNCSPIPKSDNSILKIIELWTESVEVATKSITLTCDDARFANEESIKYSCYLASLHCSLRRDLEAPKVTLFQQNSTRNSYGIPSSFQHFSTMLSRINSITQTGYRHPARHPMNIDQPIPFRPRPISHPYIYT